MKRPPAGHASAGFSAIWALFTEVLPKAKTFEPAELREIALKLDLPEGSSGQRQRHQVHQQRLARRPEGRRPESARLDRRLAVAEDRQRPGVPADAGHRTSPIMVPLPRWSKR